MGKIKYKVGDRFIQGGRVYRIFKVRKKKNTGGESERIIYFKPHFKSKMDNGLVCSIPSRSINESNIRRPADKKRVRKIIDRLSKKMHKNGKVDLSELKDELNENKPLKTAKVLKALWRDKNNENTSFSPSKKRAFKRALRNISEEIAYVNKIKLDTAQKRVKSWLSQSLP